MPVTLTLAMPPGRSRDLLVGELVAAGAEVTAIDPASAPVGMRGDALVHMPGEDPFDGTTSDLPGQVSELSALAAAAGARFVLCSSALLYADGGEREMMANDPEFDPPPGLGPLAEAELACFSSAAELMVLRLGLVLDRESPMTNRLIRAVQSGLPARPGGRDIFLPILDRKTLAEALVAVSPSSLHGAWDLVSAVTMLDEVEEIVLEALPDGRREAGESPLGANPDLLRSRRVTGEALRGTGACTAGSVGSIVARALGDRSPGGR